MAEEKNKKKKKSDIMVDPEGTVEQVVSEQNSMKKEKKKKKKKNRENKDGFAGEDEEIGGSERVELVEDVVVKKKSKKQKVDSETDEDGEKEKETNEEKKAEVEPEDGVKKKKKKKNKETKVDSEADNDKEKKQSKKETDGDEIGNSESSKVCEKPLVDTDDANQTKGKRKRDGCDLGAQEDTEKEMKRKSKKKKPSVDPEVEDNNLNSTKGAKKKSKEKKQSVDSEAKGNDLNSTKDAKKKRKKKKKQSEDLEAGENNNDGKDAKKKRKKQESDKDVTTPSSKSTKKVKFSEKLEIFQSEDEETDEEEVKVVRGKRFTEAEDEQVKLAVIEYVENHALGDEGIKMVMECKLHPQIKGCWKEIASALPWRTLASVYNRAHTLFEAGSKGVWTKEDLELVLEYQKKHGNDWRTLADAMGKHRKHVKDAYRRTRLQSKTKGHWTRQEYQNLFDLVNKDLKMKAVQDKYSKHGMLRDNIPWMSISDELGTRDHVHCCGKWYDQLQSPLVAKGIWANVDDYRLVEELLKLDAACIDDVDWDELLEHRDGEICRKRWNQMVLHIGVPRSKTFAEQVEILADRYRPELAEDREDFDNRPFDPED